jgi:hypothetical protein
MKIGDCKLCQQHRPLAHSHVFPEFFYEPTYDENHRFISVSTHSRQKPKPFEKGLREYLLCLECEARINHFETYAASILRASENYRNVDGSAIEIPDFDYPRFKLFGLSLIWRSHISGLHFFSGVNLGPHAEKLRTMLFAQDPGKPGDYCFTLVKIEGPTSAETIMHSPAKVRFRGHYAYIFLAYGFEWIFIVSSHSNQLLMGYPFVGVEPDLIILVERKSQREFLQEMRERMPELVKKRHRAT